MLFPLTFPSPRRFIRNAGLAAALFVAGLPLAGAQSMAVTAFVVSKSNCKIDTANLLLAFGNINQASTTTATASVNGVVSCKGGKDPTVAVALTLGTGNHAAGGWRRMLHGTVASEYMRYGVSISPATAIINKNSSLTFTVTGTVLAPDYQDVMAGNYSDTVIISVAP